MTPQALAWRFLHGLSARPVALLESPGKGSQNKERFSLLAGEPLFVLEGRGAHCQLICGGQRWPLKKAPEGVFRQVGACLAKRSKGPRAWPLVTAFSYEAGERFERFSKPFKEPLGLPDWWAFLPGLWASWGPKQGAWRLERAGIDPALQQNLAEALGLPVEALAAAARAPEEAYAQARDWARRGASAPLPRPAPVPGPPVRFQGSGVFKRRVRAAQRHILDGDIYQANLAHAWRARYEADSFDLYRRLTTINPSPMAAFVDLGASQVVSASPEHLFRLRGRQLETWPIAGTAPRRGRAGERAALRRSAKNAAEHVMLVDLERNDLGRVCVGGSVKVPRFRAVESYSHVHHLVSQVTGRLKPGLDLVDVLEAGFPGGSITGVPKTRCRQIIRGLERRARGWYTGSLGWWDPRRGQADLNILIRTLFIQGGQAHASVGAGIVLDSDPQAEWEETLAKAAALLKALGVRA